ncbi:hypothetical protein [Planobispora takensis]|uniref:Uncharacterized protein n=1 Tax=Planobispora takensis TaxID=1367882 RepID=A0A8J3T6L8_9ACTN|nr:hypothetical protein [Planobispora takensis]GII05145.1 hypothetical protein Pta02_71530 [Planobispora takensis]
MHDVRGRLIDFDEETEQADGRQAGYGLRLKRLLGQRPLRR